MQIGPLLDRKNKSDLLFSETRCRPIYRGGQNTHSWVFQIL